MQIYSIMRLAPKLAVVFLLGKTVVGTDFQPGAAKGVDNFQPGAFNQSEASTSQPGGYNLQQETEVVPSAPSLLERLHSQSQMDYGIKLCGMPGNTWFYQNTRYSIKPDSHVEICNLFGANSENFNGRRGVVGKKTEDGKWEVTIQFDEPGYKRLMNPENLRTDFIKCSKCKTTTTEIGLLIEKIVKCSCTSKDLENFALCASCYNGESECLKCGPTALRFKNELKTNTFVQTKDLEGQMSKYNRLLAKTLDYKYRTNVTGEETKEWTVRITYPNGVCYDLPGISEANLTTEISNPRNMSVLTCLKENTPVKIGGLNSDHSLNGITGTTLGLFHIEGELRWLIRAISGEEYFVKEENIIFYTEAAEP